MSKKEKLDEFHYHEVIDRLMLVGVLLDEAFMTHPVVQRHKKIRNKIHNASKELAEAYQLTGGISYSKFDRMI